MGTVDQMEEMRERVSDLQNSCPGGAELQGEQPGTSHQVLEPLGVRAFLTYQEAECHNQKLGMSQV